MAVLINDFEVITEPPHSQAANATPPPGSPVQAPPTVSPEIIKGVWRRELDRSARSYAG